MAVTDELRRRAGCNLGVGEVGAMADRIEDAVRDRYVELPTDSGGEVIRVGDRVYGQDGHAWDVKAIGSGSYCVWARCGTTLRQLKPRWLTHRKPLAEVGRMVALIAAKGTGITIDDISRLEAIARDLEGRTE